MSTVPSSPAEMQAFIVERLKDRRDEVSDLGIICDIVGKKLATFLIDKIPERIDEVIEVRALEREEQATPDLISAVKEDRLLFEIGEKENQTTGYASVDSGAAAIFLGASLGADENSEIQKLTCPLTPMESGVLKLCASILASALEDAKLASCAHDVVDIRDQSDIDEADIELNEFVSFGFALTFGENEGAFDIHVPKHLLTKSNEPVTAENDNLSKWHASLRDGIMQMNVGVKAVIKLDPTTLGNLNSLQIGDVIELPAENPHTAVLTARGKTLFIGQFGRIGARYSVRVERPDQRKVDLVEHIMSTM